MKQEFKEIPLNQIEVAVNYRKTLGEKPLKELAASIRAHGVHEPIIVTVNGNGKYRIVAGQRRFRASEMAGLVTIPAIVREIAEADVLTIQIVENMQRENVPFMEEADALRRLRDEQDLDAKGIAKLIGKSEVYTTYMLQLTRMEPEAQTLCRDGQIAKGTAWLIARLPAAHQIEAAAALARPKGKHIHEHAARKYVRSAFGEAKPRPRRVNARNASKIAANWKTELLNFTAGQFEEFKSVVRGRTETAIWVEAVESVLLSETQY